MCEWKVVYKGVPVHILTPSRKGTIKLKAVKASPGSDFKPLLKEYRNSLVNCHKEEKIGLKKFCDKLRG